MTSHQLAIAKASFSAGLLRPDPTSLSHDEIADFHSILNSAIIHCTPRNVQTCKQWILENIVQSTARCTALGKYLTSLATSFTEPGEKKDSTTNREPSIKRKRLHILYLINDLLHHAKYHINDASICGKVQPILVGLFGSTASFKGCPRHMRKVLDLLEIWEEKAYYSRDYIEKLREAVKNASLGEDFGEGGPSSGEKEQGLATKNAKSTPYVMPAMHGDASTPWFDLPAGNLMPHIVPNSTRPINPDMIKPLQFVAGPADGNLVLAVKALLDDVEVIYGGEATNDEEKAAMDIDELGQPIILDEITGEVIDGEGYYGWSRTFCEKMKRRKKGLDLPKHDDDRGRRSRSGSSSSGRRKRSRSDSRSSSRGGRRPTRRRSSHSSSRSRSPDRGRRNDHSRLRSRSRSYSRSPQPPRGFKPSEPFAARAVNPIPPPPHEDLPPRPPAPMQSIPPPPFQQSFNPNFPPPLPLPQYPGMPFNGPGAPFGAWPPPMQNMNFNANQQYGAWPPPPPPPGNPPFNYQQQQQPPNQYQQPGQYPPSGPGVQQPGQFQQPGGPNQYPPSGPGVWQGNGRGGAYNNNGWNNGAYRGGRGNSRGGGRGGW